MSDEEKQLLRRLLATGRMWVAVQEHRFEDLPSHFDPEQCGRTPREVEEFLKGRMDGLLEAYTWLTDDGFREEEFEGEDFPVLAFAQDRLSS